MNFLERRFVQQGNVSSCIVQKADGIRRSVRMFRSEPKVDEGTGTRAIGYRFVTEMIIHCTKFKIFIVLSNLYANTGEATLVRVWPHWSFPEK